MNPNDTLIISERPLIDPPADHRQVLLHSCCAPCSGEVLEAMHHSGIEVTVYFYNPNIHPQKEYLLRKEENIRFADKMGIPFVDADYDTGRWFERTRGMENDQEKGRRCSTCFDMRFEQTAAYANEHGFKVFTSCLGISRWKDIEQINGCGIRAASRYPDLQYWPFNWRKQGGSHRMYEIAKHEGFYKQEYCGCVYSLRDTNNRRQAYGKSKIHIGVEHYSDLVAPGTDAESAKASLASDGSCEAGHPSSIADDPKQIPGTQR